MQLLLLPSPFIINSYGVYTSVMLGRLDVHGGSKPPGYEGRNLSVLHDVVLAEARCGGYES